MAVSPPDFGAYLRQCGLQVTNQRGPELDAKCPQHVARTGHEDHHPSFSFNQVKLVGKCQSCGYAPSLAMLVEDLTGEPPDSDIMVEAQAASIKRALTAEKRKALGWAFHEWTLTGRFVSVPDRMRALKRLKAPALDTFGVRWDPQQHCFILPFRDVRGLLLGWQRKQQGGVLTEPTGLAKSEVLFGMSVMKDHERMVLVESPLDAVRLWGAGIPAVSSAGAMVSNAQVDLLCRHTSLVIVALDNDRTGKDQTPKVVSMVQKKGGAAFLWRYGPEWKGIKDPGDAPDDSLLQDTWHRSLRLGL